MNSPAVPETFQMEIQPSLECPVCNTTYNRTQHAPLILLCGHTLCKSCVSKLYHPDKSIVCPLDRKLDNRKFSHIPHSLLVVEMIDTITRMKEQIDFLKLSSEEKRLFKTKRLEEAAAEYTDFISNVETRIADVRNLAETVVNEIHESFTKFYQGLEDRKGLLEEQVDAIQEEQLTKYKKLESEIETQADDLQQHPPDFAKKGEAVEVPQTELKCIYVREDKSNLDVFRNLGKVEFLSNKVPYECEHFMNISYWMLPPCCGRHYCCNKCHDKRESHVWQYADKMVCMYCSREQPYRKLPNTCECCGAEHRGVISKT